MPTSRGNSTPLESSLVLSTSLAESNRRSEYLSLGLCGLLALTFAIMVPPLQINDEHGHFIRAYEISRGEFVARGAPDLPASIAAFVMRYPEAAERPQVHAAGDPARFAGSGGALAGAERGSAEAR